MGRTTQQKSKIPQVASKTQHRQIDKYLKRKKLSKTKDRSALKSSVWRGGCVDWALSGQSLPPEAARSPNLSPPPLPVLRCEQHFVFIKIPGSEISTVQKR